MGKWMSKQRHGRRYSENDDRTLKSKYHSTNKSNSLDSSNVRRQMGPKHNIVQCHTDTVTSLDVLSTNNLVSAGEDKRIIVQDVENGKIVQMWKGHKMSVKKICCRNNLTFSCSRDKTLKIWKVGTEICVGTLEGHTLIVTSVAANKEGNLICSGSRDNSVCLWDIETKTCLKKETISRNLVTDLKWWNENLLVQTSEDKILKLWDTRNLKVVHNFKLQQQIHTCVDVSGNYCISGCNGFNGTGCQVQLWDLRKKELVQEYKGHYQNVSCCIFSQHSSSTFLSCSHDGSIKLWNEDKQKSVRDEPLGVGALTCIKYLDDQTLVSGSFEHGITELNIKNWESTVLNVF